MMMMMILISLPLSLLLSVLLLIIIMIIIINGIHYQNLEKLNIEKKSTPDFPRISSLFPALNFKLTSSWLSLIVLNQWREL